MRAIQELSLSSTSAVTDLWNQAELELGCERSGFHSELVVRMTMWMNCHFDSHKVFQCQELKMDSFCKRNILLRVVSVTRCCERCDATRSTCVFCDTTSRMSVHPLPGYRACPNPLFVTVLRVTAKELQLFVNCSGCPFRDCHDRGFVVTTQSESPNKQISHKVCH